MNSTLVSKLHHPLAEIRNRALGSISFKLKTGLYSTVDLAHEHNLIEMLLNWLSQESEEYTQQRDLVLQLLMELVKKPIAQKKVTEGGGILLLRRLESICTSQKTIETIHELLSLLLHGQQDQQGPKVVANETKESILVESFLEISSMSKYAPTIISSQKYSRGRSESPQQKSTRPETWERSTTSPLRRRYSPERQSKHHYANDFPSPPYLPNLFILFDHIYLSPIDEQIVSHFCSMVTSATVDVVEESKLFDILSIDFGAHIFLQRSQLFRSIMNGLDSESDPRLYQNLEYLDSLIVEWAKLFRKSADTFASISTSTPVNNTPNASVNAATIENFDDSNLNGDYLISLPFAAHELFIKLTSMMKYMDLIPLILRILYGVLPFLKLHVETVINKVSRESEDLDPNFNQNMTLYYFCHVSDALVYFEECSMDSYLHQLKEEVIYFGLLTYSTLCFSSKSVFTFTTVIEAFTQGSLPHSIPSSFSSFILVSKEQEHLIIGRQWILFLCNHSQSWISTEIYALLNYAISNTPSRLTHLLQDLSLLSFLCQQALLDDKNSKSILTVINFFILSSDDVHLIRRLIPLTMALYSIDQGSLFKATLEKSKELLNNTDKNLIWIYALLNRQEGLRQYAFNQLDLASWNEGTPFLQDQPWNCFFIPSHALSKFVANEPAKDTFRDPKKLFNFVEKQILVLKNESSSLEQRKLALYDLTSSAHLAVVQEHLMDQKVLEFFTVSLFSLNSAWIHDVEILEFVFKIIRLLYEGRGSQVLSDSFVFMSLAKYSFFPSPQVRYNLARILFYRFIIDYSEPQLGLLNTLRVSELLANQYIIYCPIETPVLTIQLELDSLQLDWLISNIPSYRSYALSPFNGSTSTHLLFPTYFKDSLERLENAKSHSEFEQTFNEIAGLIYLDGQNVELDGFYKIMNRFIKTSPASADDRCLLSKILLFLGRMYKTPQSNTLIHDELLLAIQNLFLPILEEQSKSHEFQTKKAHVDATSLGLATEVIGFMANFIKHLDQPDLGKLVTCTKCIDIIADFSYYVFSSENGLAKSHYLRLHCLYCLLPFASLPSLLSLTSGDSIAHLIQLLVQILGSFQKTFSNFVDGNAFTYKDSYAYKWAALCLRNLSKSITNFENGESSWIWGDHWLYSNDIEWLVVLLNDDEKIVQKFGLGILSNLILIKASFNLLSTKIPRYLDMAFLYVLDFDRHEMLRTEALLIINNFVYLYSLEKRLTLDHQQQHVQVQSHVQSHVQNGQLQDDGATSVEEIIHTFEQSGFFDQLREIIDSFGSASYRFALVELLLNLSLLIPGYLNMKLLETNCWPGLVNYVNDSTNESHEALSPEEYESLFYDSFKKNQFNQIYANDISQIQVNVFKMIRILLFKDELLRSTLIEKTHLVSYLKTLVPSKTPDSESCLFACKVLGDLLPFFFTESKSSLLLDYFNPETVYHTLWTCLVLLKQRENVDCRRVGCYLIARLFSLHFGEIVYLDLNSHLEADVDIDGQVLKMGVYIFRELVDILIEHYDLFDLSFMESVRLALQCLLGRCNFAKSDALEIGLPMILESRAKTIFSFNTVSNKKLDESLQISLFIITTLYRHLFAGYEQVKIACSHVPLLTYDILSVKDPSEPLLLETLCCLRNYVANCNATKKLLLLPMKDSSYYSSSLPCVVDKVLQISQKQTVSDEVFFASFELFKIMASFAESRNVLLKVYTPMDSNTDDKKSNLTLKMSDQLIIYLKSKSLSRIDAMLQYLVNLSFSADGQSQVIRIPGILGILFDILSTKSHSVRLSCLYLLRNLAMLKENKAHFLVDDVFVEKIKKILGNKSLKLIHASTSLIWVLVYDYEKAKVCMKRSNVKQDLFNLEKRLLSDYTCLQSLNVMQLGTIHDPIELPDMEEISRQDYELLIQSLRQLSLISRLLK